MCARGEKRFHGSPRASTARCSTHSGSFEKCPDEYSTSLNAAKVLCLAPARRTATESWRSFASAPSGSSGSAARSTSIRFFVYRILSVAARLSLCSAVLAARRFAPARSAMPSGHAVTPGWRTAPFKCDSRTGAAAALPRAGRPLLTDRRSRWRIAPCHGNVLLLHFLQTGLARALAERVQTKSFRTLPPPRCYSQGLP